MLAAGAALEVNLRNPPRVSDEVCKPRYSQMTLQPTPDIGGTPKQDWCLQNVSF